MLKEAISDGLAPRIPEMLDGVRDHSITNSGSRTDSRATNDTPSGKLSFHQAGDPLSQPCLTNAARADERQQLHVVSCEKV